MRLLVVLVATICGSNQLARYPRDPTSIRITMMSSSKAMVPPNTSALNFRLFRTTVSQSVCSEISREYEHNYY
jgi:hypothetical protein